MAASECPCRQYPDVHGLSPRNLRRMRDFFRTYENEPKLMAQAMEVGWTQNVLILEVDLNMEQCMWYLQAVRQFGWAKTELTAKIAENAHEFIVLAITEEMCYSGQQGKVPPVPDNVSDCEGKQKPAPGSEDQMLVANTKRRLAMMFHYLMADTHGEADCLFVMISQICLLTVLILPVNMKKNVVALKFLCYN